MSEQFIVHCHVPGSDGTAFTSRVLRPAFGDARIYKMYAPELERTAQLPAHGTGRAMRSFAATGHVPFGYVDHIYPDALYVSLFHDPVTRFLGAVSAHVSGRSDDCDPDDLVRPLLDDAHLRTVHANTQTKLAAGIALGRLLTIGSSALDLAIRNLGHTRFLTGREADLDQIAHEVTTRIAPHIGNISKRTGSPTARSATEIPPYAHEGAVATSVAAADLSPRLVREIAEINDLDRRLYDAVLNLQQQSRAA